MRLRNAVGRPSMRDIRRGIPSNQLASSPALSRATERLDSPENTRRVFVSRAHRESYHRGIYTC